MSLPESVLNLIRTFESNLDFYRSNEYNEFQLRQEFLDPFFAALGWDMNNEAGLAPQYRDVIHEASIKIGSSTKAPDYAFSIHGQYKFFLEAKKPSVNIRDDTEPAYQLRRYGWSAKLPVSILTDFEEFAVYDCRKRPKHGERAAASRIDYFRYTDYAEKWDELRATFSKGAILEGSFDKFAIVAKRHRGTETVDGAFLDEIGRWRSLLARNFAIRNPSLSVRDLNFAVQKTIDRIIFLRICEDRGTEDYKRLAALLDGPRVYTRLMEQFLLADTRYNSGLFHFSTEKRRGAPDAITPDLALDDKVLKEIISKLYYPESPYEFSVLPADILGHVYEQFLGKTIRLTSGHKAKIEEKPEVRKAGGVYYTPSYIVNYIVNSTLGHLLNGNNQNKPKPISVSKAAEIKVLDPACGSGSFLIVAYQFLLDWHLRKYTVDPETDEPDEGKIRRHSAGKRPKLYQSPGGEWKLTTDERKRILLNSIYGVDIDPQAVEVTKLSLLLKVVEGEAHQIKQRDWIHERQRILPDLGNNVKCGNSLIGPDFYDNEQMLLLEDELQYRINVFDWNLAFPKVTQRGGFDCVIGNPPYVFGRDWKLLGISEDERNYFVNHYTWSPYQLDMFSLFMERCSQLASATGRVGQIVPNIWLTNTYSALTREKILKASTDLIVTDPPRDVFTGLTVDTVLYTYEKSDKQALYFHVRTLNHNGSVETLSTLQVSDYEDGSRPISLRLSEAAARIIYRLAALPVRLGDLANITRGVHSYRTGGYGQSAFGSGRQTKRDCEERPYHSMKKLRGYRPFIYGKNLKRYGTPTVTEFVKYGSWLAEPRGSQFFEGQRIYSRKILANRLVVTLVDDDSVTDQQVYITKPAENSAITSAYLCGILASKLIAFYIYGYYDESLDAFPQVKVGQLRSLPMPTINFENGDEVSKHDRLVKLVNRITDLYRKKASEANPDTRLLLEAQISSTDRQIDLLVYDLYNLSAEEIALVESHASK